MDPWVAKARLENEKAEIVDRMEDTDNYGLGEGMHDELSELSLYDNHPADIASELFEREKDLGLKVGDKARILDINTALEAIQNGTYGNCQHCQMKIPDERLEAYPSSILCVSCKQSEESTHPWRERPIEEKVLSPGFGQYNFDGMDQTGFDSEDGWQAVERFNETPRIYEQIPLDDNTGIVDSMDEVSNEYYESQLPPSRKYHP